MRRILIVDDEKNVHYSFQRALGDEYEVQAAHSGGEALDAVRASPPDVVLLDLNMPGKSGFETLDVLREEAPSLPVIIMTAFGSTSAAIRATASSARDYLLKPVDVPSLRRLLREVLPSDEPARPAAPPVESGEPMIGSSPPMQALYKKIGRAAGADVPVLVRGESGTGKELVARAIHRHSNRNERPLVAMNCAAVPESLLEAELFGYERGAFTGAESSRPGTFERAHRGTLILDEIGDMAPRLQAKLLRVLQSGEVARLGGRGTERFDVRVVAMTHADLEAKMREGSFREDLFYRLNVLPLFVPPLRERGDDVLVLANHFLETERRRHGRFLSGFTADCEAAIRAHPWPGNVRELENAIARSVLRARGDRIDLADLALEERSPEWTAERRDEAFPERVERYLRENEGRGFEELEGLVFRVALAITAGNQVRASKLLGVSRNVLRHRMAKYGLA